MKIKITHETKREIIKNAVRKVLDNYEPKITATGILTVDDAYEVACQVADELEGQI